MSGFLVSVASGVVGNAVFVSLTAVGAYAFLVGMRRRELCDFWGLRSVRKIRIYVSHLRVVQQGTTVGADGMPRSFTGSVVTLLETEMATLLRGLFFASLPGRAIQPAWLMSLLLINADAEILASPVGTERPEPDGAVVALGSPGYNSVSREIEDACHSPIRFVNDNSAIELPGNFKLQAERQGIVVRLECSDRYWFYAAGLSEAGTAAAAFYLATSWRRLHRRYRKTPSFYVVVEFSGNDFRTCRVVSEGALYES